MHSLEPDQVRSVLELVAAGEVVGRRSRPAGAVGDSCLAGDLPDEAECWWQGRSGEERDRCRS